MAKPNRIAKRANKTRNANEFKRLQMENVKGEQPLNRAQRRAAKRGKR